MKTRIVFLLFFCISLRMVSQDTIVKTDSAIIFAKVLEISINSISYKEANGLDRLSYTIPKEKVAFIKYQNGNKDVFNEIKIEKKKEEVAVEKTNPKNDKHTSPLDIPDYKKHRLSFSINIFSLIRNERSIYIDYLYNYRHSVGISIGQIFANRQWQDFREFFNSVNEADNPGPIYDGWIARINYKLYFNHQRRQFAGVGLMYANGSYSNQNLVKRYRYKNDLPSNYFLRSETSNEYGLYLTYGIHLLRIINICNIEAFSTIGALYQNRNYTTYTSIPNRSWRGGDPLQPVGTFSNSNVYPMFTIGLKLGINAFFK